MGCYRSWSNLEFVVTRVVCYASRCPVERVDREWAYILGYLFHVRVLIRYALSWWYLWGYPAFPYHILRPGLTSRHTFQGTLCPSRADQILPFYPFTDLAKSPLAQYEVSTLLLQKNAQFFSIDLTETTPAAPEGVFPESTHAQIWKKTSKTKKKKTKHSTWKIIRQKKANEWESALHRRAQQFRWRVGYTLSTTI